MSGSAALCASASISLPSARVCAERSSSEVRLPGTCTDFPQTICSGEHPRCLTRAFLAWKTCINARSKATSLTSGLSLSSQASISLAISPCRSIRPRCRAAAVTKVRVGCWFPETTLKPDPIEIPPQGRDTPYVGCQPKRTNSPLRFAWHPMLVGIESYGLGGNSLLRLAHE